MQAATEPASRAGRHDAGGDGGRRQRRRRGSPDGYDDEETHGIESEPGGGEQPLEGGRLPAGRQVQVGRDPARRVEHGRHAASQGEQYGEQEQEEEDGDGDGDREEGSERTAAG